jgi:vacuolar protein sorting-associated protein 51
MSTIASPRESSVTGRRLPSIATPTSSSRPSIDSPSNVRSADASPNRNPPPQPRRNRAALREYYNLKKEEKADDASSEYSINDHSDVQESEMDREGFDAEVYVKQALETQSLEELLKTYNQVLTGALARPEVENKSGIWLIEQRHPSPRR